MSVRVSSLVWQLDVPMGDKIVLLKMADCANDKGESIHPSCAQVAKDCGCSERHVRRVWAEYRDRGLLVGDALGGRCKATVYAFDMAVLKGASVAPFADETVQDGQGLETGKDAVRSPFIGEETLTDSHPLNDANPDTETVNTCQGLAEKGATGAINPDTQSRAVEINLNQNSISGARQEPGKGGVGGKTKGSGREVPIPECLDTPEFLEAWRRWFVFRREDGHALTRSTAEVQLKKLAKVGPVVAAAMIDQSIEHGWQGLFAVKGASVSVAHSAQDNLKRLEARLSH